MFIILRVYIIFLFKQSNCQGFIFNFGKAIVRNDVWNPPQNRVTTFSVKPLKTLVIFQPPYPLLIQTSLKFWILGQRPSNVKGIKTLFKEYLLH